MEFNLSEIGSKNSYKLLTGVVVPRPIAFVTSRDETGRLNAAPFSFFNLMGSAPPMIALNVGDRPEGGPKDTARNIRRQREFVVNIVDDALMDRMNLSAADFPPEISEVEVAGLTPVPSSAIGTPRLVESPVNLECREIMTVEIGGNRVIFGEILRLHIRDEFVDPVRFHVHTEALRPVGRMHGGGGYVHTTDIFQLPRISYAEWAAREGE